MGRAAPPNAVSSTLEYRSLTGAWVPIQTTTGSVTGLLGMWDTASLPPGDYTLRLRASDAKLGDLQATVSVGVGPTTGSAGNALVSLSPNASGPISTATFPITGFVVTKSLFDYTVEVGVGTAPTSWIALGQGKSEVMGGVLAQWNTTAFPDGPYTLRLTVREVTGKISQVLAYPTLKRSAP